MDSSIFRKEILANRFGSSDAVVAIRGLPSLTLFFVALIITWLVFFYVLTVSEHLETERFVGITVPADEDYIELEQNPTAKPLGLIIIPRTSAANVIEGFITEIKILNSDFATLPPIRTKIIRIVDNNDLVDDYDANGANVMGVVIFPGDTYMHDGNSFKLESGVFFQAHIRTKTASLLDLMLRPLEKFKSGKT